MQWLHLIVVALLGLAAADVCPTGPQPPDTTSGGMVYTYPYSINYQSLPYQQQTLCQAYMDIGPSCPPNGKVVVVLHGKNFCSVTWNATIDVLASRGFRIIAPDQVGFCKSSKPQSYQYSFQQLALNTKTILDNLNITSVTVMGHSMGGMLASRFALMYPSLVERLIMVNPLGLEDWKAKGVPYLPIDSIFKTELASNYTSIRSYEQMTYYVNTWKADYDAWVYMLLTVYHGSLGRTFAYDQALVTDMVITQPTIYEYPLLANTRTLLVVGQKDNTAIGKQWSPPAVQAILGNYSVLGKEAKARIGDNCTLVEYADLGHSPQVQDPDRFHASLLEWLSE